MMQNIKTSAVALLLLIGPAVSGVEAAASRSAAASAHATPPAAPCEVQTTGVTEAGEDAARDDAARAHAACEASRSRFAALFGDPVPEVSVVVWEEPRYRAGVRNGRAVIFWPSSEAMAARAPNAEAAERHVAAQWREVLPHEIAHVLLAVHVFGGEGQGVRGGYGTPLPDWLDEAIAIRAEPTSSVRARIEQARSLPPEWLKLRTILAMPHPATGGAAAYTARDGTAASPDQALWAFYQQSIAVLAFVHDAGGSEAVRELVRRLAADPDAPHALAGLPGLPPDFDGVLAAWDDWLKAR